MRKWHKYFLDSTCKGRVYIPIDHGFGDHEKTMGGYKDDDAYCSKEAFLNKYFWGYHSGRLEYYDDFLRKHIEKQHDILSIASGRSANELLLGEDGYRITCSDLKTIDAYQKTKALFPQFDFIEHDILNRPLQKKYDVIICLSLIYLFDEKDLLSFFKKVV